MNPPAISVHSLVKRYEDLTAVDGIQFSVPQGICLGLLGPNGAGKTTTIEILEGLLDRDAGTVEILGKNWSSHGDWLRERIGVQLQDTRFPEKLTVTEILRLFRSLYKRGRDPEEVLGVVGLEEKRDTRTIKLSGGQQQRLALGCALINQPDILFLDEPTTGLDPQARRRVWDVVEQFKAGGGTVLLTTHYMDEAERLSDQLVIMDHGKIIAEGTPEQIIGSLNAENIIAFALENGGAQSLELETIPGVLTVRTGDVIELVVSQTNQALPTLLDRIRKQELAVADLRLHRPTLEDVFVSLTGRNLRES